MLCVKPLIEFKSDKLRKQFGNFVSYKHFPLKDKLNKLLSTNEIVMYPCGQCLPCINMNRHHWVKKLEIEKQQWPNTYFLTLTYNQYNVPEQLNVKDCQKFIKYLRRLINPDGKSGYSLRYFICGEYGSHTKRPHYHAIIFTNYSFDLVHLKNTKNGPLYDCQLINKAWLNKGFVWVGYDDNSKSFAYVSAYSNKCFLKQHQNKEYRLFGEHCLQIYQRDDLTGFQKYCAVDNSIDMIKFKKNEFIVCSKNPPLGSAGLDKFVTKCPSTLLKWSQRVLMRDIEQCDDKIKQLELLYDYDDNNCKNELNKRFFNFKNFLRYNNVRDIIDSNKLLLDKKIKRAVKSNSIL